jgi:tetratricopeptide (TPR) repeat protein/transcriptional regulator with XRE-family HTH domain
MRPRCATSCEARVTEAKALGSRIRAWRESAGLSQERLAERAGLSVRAVRNIENGRTDWPRAGSLVRLADALALEGAARAELLGPAERPGAEASPAPAGADGRAGVVPRQLPASVRQFAGRDRELALLADLGAEAYGTSAAVVISAIDGSAGIGKTALAVQFGHQAAAAFPDGQLYVNLAGFGPSGPPVAPAQALRGFLDALGVEPGRIPPGLEDQAGLYRSLLAGRRMLVVLDNAAGEEQVRPLLPGAPGCLALVTSRRKLAGLAATDGAVLITLDYLNEAQALDMLSARLGAGRVAGEPAAAGEIVRLCAGMPLALAIAAARAAARPAFPLAALAAALAAAGRLDTLDAGDPAVSIRAAFFWSYQQLKPAAARMFRLLGLHPGPDISAPAAASLAAISPDEARRLLGDLADASLITEHLPGRYTLHDLIREYAAELSLTHEGPGDRDTAIGRLLDHYLHTADACHWLTSPAGQRVLLAPPRPGTTPEQYAGRQQAMAWFEAEHQVLLAAITLADTSAHDTVAWQLPWAISEFLNVRGHWQDWAATQRTALAAATRLGDAPAQALASRLLAVACRCLGNLDELRSLYAMSLALYQQLGDREGEAHVQEGLALLADAEGRYPAALEHAQNALRLYQGLGEQRHVAYALNNVGWYLGVLGDYQQARDFCRRAVTLATETGDARLLANAWDSLATAEQHLGNHDEAVACYHRAVSTARETGDRWLEGTGLDHLGDALHASGDPPGARQAWQQALVILEDRQDRSAGEVRAKLASTAALAILEDLQHREAGKVPDKIGGAE